MPYVLTDNQMSDLFFNHEKPELSAAYAADAEPDELDAALRHHAQEFSDMTGVPVEWLVNDYNSRV